MRQRIFRTDAPAMTAQSDCGKRWRVMATRRLGLESDRVMLLPYDAAWPRLFRRERLRLRRALGGRICAVEHIGSTAVPGMAAKPIIDIAVRLRSSAERAACRRLLREAGYEDKGTFGLPGRYFFTAGTPVSVHIHVVGPSSRHWLRWMTFRGVLRRDVSTREAYRLLKMRLARRYRHNRKAYTAAKDPFIESVLDRARASLVGHPRRKKT